MRASALKPLPPRLPRRAGLDPHVVDPATGATLLHAAHDHHDGYGDSSGDIVRLLVAAGVPLDRPDGSQLTPLLHQCKPERVSACVVRALIEAGADVHARTERGESAAHLLASVWDYEGLGGTHESQQSASLLQVLAAAGLPVTAVRDAEGWTPLHTAAFKGPPDADVGALCELLELGADPNARDNDGNTPLHLLRGDIGLHSLEGLDVLEVVFVTGMGARAHGTRATCLLARLHVDPRSSTLAVPVPPSAPSRPPQSPTASRS